MNENIYYKHLTNIHRNYICHSLNCVNNILSKVKIVMLSKMIIHHIIWSEYFKETYSHRGSVSQMVKAQWVSYILMLSFGFGISPDFHGAGSTFYWPLSFLVGNDLLMINYLNPLLHFCKVPSVFPKSFYSSRVPSGVKLRSFQSSECLKRELLIWVEWQIWLLQRFKSPKNPNSWNVFNSFQLYNDIFIPARSDILNEMKLGDHSDVI